MIKRRTIHLSLAMLVLTALSLYGSPAEARPAPNVYVQIDPSRTLTLNGSFIGLGAEDDSNMLWSGPNRAAGARPAVDIDAFVSPRLRALSLPFVRKFIDVSWFAPTPDGYTWDTAAMQALYANLALHRSANTRVMLTIWSLPPWLSAEPARDKDTELRPAVPFPDAAHEARWAVLVADLLRHLHGLDGSGLTFTNVAYVGGPNELARIDAGRLVRPFGLLRERLAEAGLAGRVAVFGPDSFVEELLIAHSTPGLGPLLDLYDFHYYAAAPVEAGFVAAVDRLTAAVAPSGKQIWLTEFGELTAKNDDWRSLPIFAIGGINHGLAAISVWNVQDQIYNTKNMPEWGLWGVYDSGYALKSAYYAWQMMVAHLPAGATVYGHSCDREQCPTLRVAVLGSGGALAVLVYNLADTPQQLSLNLNGLPIRRSIGRYMLDPARPLPVGLSVPREDAPALVAGVLHDTLPPAALVVYATDQLLWPNPSARAQGTVGTP